MVCLLCEGQRTVKGKDQDIRTKHGVLVFVVLKPRGSETRGWCGNLPFFFFSSSAGFDLFLFETGIRLTGAAKSLQRSVVHKQALMVEFGSAWVRSKEHVWLTLTGLVASPSSTLTSKHSLKVPRKEPSACPGAGIVLT